MRTTIDTSNSKILYVRHYIAEIGGESSRHCGNCVCTSEDSRMYYNFGCKRPQNCTCALCRKQPLSLKTACSEVVFGLLNEHKFRYENKITCERIEIPQDFYFTHGSVKVSSLPLVISSSMLAIVILKFAIKTTNNNASFATNNIRGFASSI